MTDRTGAADPILAMVPEIRGRRVLQPCVLYGRLGRGGMGAVYLGKHLTLMQKQVVKCLWLMGSGNPSQGGFVERFQQEARIAAAMTHQNLVRVTHVDRLGELHYLVMEYVEGEDVDRRLRRTGPMHEEAALLTLFGAAQGLGYAHARGIVHRDVKPANLMISTHGEVKVIDLGLARAMDTTRQNGATVGTLGTPQYMPPEQWQDPAIGPTGDVFALGAVLHFLLTGRSPLAAGGTDFGALRAAAHDPRLAERVAGELRASRATRRLLRRCLATDPAERFVDARELAAELAELVTGDADLLIADAGTHPVAGREPSDDELRAIAEALANGEADAPVATTDATVVTADGAALDRTVQMPGATGPAAGAREHRAGDTAAMPALAATLVHGTAEPATPTPTPRLLPSQPSVRLRRRRARVAAAATAAVATLVGAAGIVMWPRVDYEALQREAMAAIYQERFDDAEHALLALERSPAFADQARRLHIDALVKAAERQAERDPVAALQQLARAKAIAAVLLIARDTDDAVARIAAARQAPRAALEAALRAAVTVQSPPAGTVITRATHAVAAAFEPGPLRLCAKVQDRPLQRGDDGLWHGAWTAPAADGPAEVAIVVEEPQTGLRQTIAVPVLVKRGAMALHVDAATAPQNAAVPELTARVDNGPLAVHATITAPDGTVRTLELGEHDGAFVFGLPLVDGLDGAYRVQLAANSDGEDITSPERSVVVDRVPPELQIDGGERWCAAPTLLIAGTATEACRVSVGGDEALAVATDAGGRFALPVTLPTTDGPFTIRLDARDAAGNTRLAAAAIPVVVDRTPPHFVADALQHVPATADERLTVTGRIDEAGVAAAGDEAPTPTAADGGFALATALPPGEIEQPVIVRLTAHDRAGNAAAPLSIPVFVDRRGPRILPGAPDGSWSAAGEWWLRVEDHSLPCTLAVDGVAQPVAADGIVRIARTAGAGELAVDARDALGNTTEHTLTAGGDAGGPAAAPPGPAWGTPVAGTGIDQRLNLHERVAIDVAGETIVLRLVRPMRDEELPPQSLRDARAVAMLQSLRPFYLAETELPVAAWRRDPGTDDAVPTTRRNYRFDPKTCQWTPAADADWRQPLHPTFTSAAPEGLRERWPVTQITAAEARAFCARHGLRLPSAEEWLAVVRMGSRDRYGWLPEGPLERRANLADLKLVALAPALAAFDAVDDGHAGPAPVDAFPSADQLHPWGFRNLLGNAAEWCTVGGERVAACGGSWLSEPRELRVGDAVPETAITGGAWDCVGFRVARDL